MLSASLLWVVLRLSLGLGHMLPLHFNSCLFLVPQFP